MVGIGTNKVDLSLCQYKYSSLLGLDNQSWGYSYRGLAQHNGRLKYYGKRYSSLCIVGVYLDLRRRFIEFYLNRRWVYYSTYIVLNFNDSFYSDRKVLLIVNLKLMKMLKYTLLFRQRLPSQV